MEYWKPNSAPDVHDIQKQLYSDTAGGIYGRDMETYLAGRGYHQDSFVRFTTLQHDGLQQEAADFGGVPLLGLGAGARSYTDTTHYSTDFAVHKTLLESTKAIPWKIDWATMTFAYVAGCSSFGTTLSPSGS